MFLRALILFSCALAVAVSLSGCTATPPAAQTGAALVERSGDRPGLKAAYSELERQGGKVYALEPRTSSVRIYVFRAGPVAKLGHNHVLSAPRFTGFVHLPGGGAGHARFDLEFRLDQLEIDNPEYRSALGGAFAAVLSREATESTRDHMLGDDGLQAERYPFVRIRSLEVAGESPKFAAKVEIELHGRKREMRVPVNVEGLPDRLVASGSFVLRQTDFGLRPYAVLGGLLAVQDEVIVEFRLVGA